MNIQCGVSRVHVRLQLLNIEYVLNVIQLNFISVAQEYKDILC